MLDVLFTIKLYFQKIPIDEGITTFDEISLDLSEEETVSWQKIAGTRRKSMGAHFGMKHFDMNKIKLAISHCTQFPLSQVWVLTIGARTPSEPGVHLYYL